MDYKTFHLIPIDEGASDFLQIYPEYDFLENLRKNIQQNVSIGGGLNTYSIAGFSWEYSISLTNVNSSTRSNIQRWWRNQERLYFTLNLSETNVEFVEVKIANTNNPFPVRTDNVYDSWDGFVRLISTEGSEKSAFGGLPFLLNNNVFGLLDQDYNFLL